MKTVTTNQFCDFLFCSLTQLSPYYYYVVRHYSAPVIRRVVKMTAKILASKLSACSSEIKDSFALSFELSKQRIRP